jgi:hypothetical protein
MRAHSSHNHMIRQGKISAARKSANRVSSLFASPAVWSSVLICEIIPRQPQSHAPDKITPKDLGANGSDGINS